MPTNLSAFPQQLLPLHNCYFKYRTTNHQRLSWVRLLLIHSFAAIDLILFSKGQEEILDHAQSNSMPLVLVFFSLSLIVLAIAVDTVEPAEDDPADGGADSESLFGGTSLSLSLSFPAL